LPPQLALPDHSVSASRFLFSFALSLFCKKGQKLTPLFSHPCVLFRKVCLSKPVAIKVLRALLQITGGGITPANVFPHLSVLATGHSSLSTFPFRIRTYEKHTPYPLRIRTSKTQDLKPFRMNTYEKTGGGVPRCRYFANPAPVLFCEERQATDSAELSLRGGDIGPRAKTLVHCLAHGGSHLEGIRYPRPYPRAYPEVPKSSVSPTHQITKASQT